MENENQRQYELTFILSPELEEKDINSFEQEVEKKIKDFGGSLKKKPALPAGREKTEKRNLAYPIKKFQFGYYLVISFLFNPEKLEELSTVFKHKKDILRYIINFVEEPALIKKKESKKKRPKSEVKKFKEITEEISKEEIEDIKKKTKEKKSQPAAGQPKAEKKKEKGARLEEIDKKLDEILGI